MTKIDSMVVEIEGHRYELTRPDWDQLDCIEMANDQFHLLENGTAHLISVIDYDLISRRCTLKVDGEIKEVTFLGDLDLLIEKMGLNNIQTKKLSILLAPMPGLVTGIKIKAGQEVEKGSTMFILEAMKMENVILAPHHAIIKEIKVALGHAVEKGTPLVEFDV